MNLFYLNCNNPLKFIALVLFFVNLKRKLKFGCDK